MRALSVTLILGISLFVAGTALAGEKVFGAGVSAPDTLLISDLLSQPDSYVGKTVRVQGTVVGLCKHRGCWINLASDNEGEVVRIKVQDGVIVFPPEILGEMVIAEGEWTANKLDLETTKKYCAAKANQAGEEHDPAQVTSCMTLYQVSGTGAVLVAAKDGP
jgi:hypothetical protein